MRASTPPRKLKSADFRVPALLILLSLVPVLGGVMRFSNMTADATLTEEHARFVISPIPIIIHVVSATLYCVLGAFQFTPAFRDRWPGLHRRVSRVLAPCGMLAGATGVWMTVFYSIPAALQGPLLYWVRLAVGTAMVASIVIAWRAILRRDVPRHEAFMIRAYALGQGAGTQVIVLLPWMLISGENGGLTRDLLMTLSWAINIAVAEAIIRPRRRGEKRGTATSPIRPSDATQTIDAIQAP